MAITSAEAIVWHTHPRTYRMLRLSTGGIQMRKVSLFAIAAAMVAIGVGVWAASTTKAGVAPSMVQGIQPFQLMMNAKDLPAQHYDDFSMVFI
jgi:hypothetical protein